MKTFKQHLLEAKINTAAIDEFLGVYWKGNGSVPPYTLTPDGLINIDCYIQIAPRIVIPRLSHLNVKIDRLPDGIRFNSAGDSFAIGDNDLVTLEGCPRFVKGDFYAGNNQLTSLEYAPENIDGRAHFTNNPINSLHNIHKHMKTINGSIKFADLQSGTCPIKSHVLGLLLIRGLRRAVLSTGFENEKLKVVEDIINKYLPNDKGRASLIDCQNELIEAGFEEFAQL